MVFFVCLCCCIIPCVLLCKFRSFEDEAVVGEMQQETNELKVYTLLLGLLVGACSASKHDTSTRVLCHYPSCI